MNRLVALIAIGAVLVCRPTTAAEDDPVQKTLTAAKEDFEKSCDKARAGLLADLKKREEVAQKDGDLKTLEKIQAEAKAFKGDGELPKSVPVKVYENQIRAARARLEETYGSAVKQYTRDGKIALAKAVQQELDVFKKGVPESVTTDPFKVKSVWVGDNPRKVLTVTQRMGEKFTATLEYGNTVERVVAGTIKGGKLSWLAKDTRAIRGGAGGDNHGTLGSDKAGDKIDFVWREDNGANGTYTLRLSKGK